MRKRQISVYLRQGHLPTGTVNQTQCLFHHANNIPHRERVWQEVKGILNLHQISVFTLLRVDAKFLQQTVDPEPEWTPALSLDHHRQSIQNS